jgi:hypothetical protein
MKDARRAYVYLAAAIALEVVVWASISLLRQLLAGTLSRDAIAFQTAAIVVALPVFLLHWHWARRALAADPEERLSLPRRVFLYGLAAAFAVPFLTNAVGLLDPLLHALLGGREPADYAAASLADLAARNLAAMTVLGALWLWLMLLTRADERAEPPTGDAATVRRLHHLTFSAAGGLLLGVGITRTLRWVLLALDTGPRVEQSPGWAVADDLTLLLVGLPLWFVAWRAADRLRVGPNAEEEQRSALRHAYLYLGVAGGALVAVANAAQLLYGGLRQLLGLETPGDWRGPVPTLAVALLILAYHARRLRAEPAGASTPRGAAVRRSVLYVVAGVGLVTLVVGLTAEVAVVVRILAGGGLGDAERDQVAWATAALLTGLPVWALAWRQAELGARASAASAAELNAAARKIYLYGFMLLAAVLVLGGAVYLVYRVLATVLGVPAPADLANRLGWAIGSLLTGGGLWLYHARSLRADEALMRRARAERLSALGVALVSPGDGSFARAVVEGLAKSLPGLRLDVIPTSAAANGQAAAEPDDGPDRLRRAGLVVAPWPLTDATAELAAAVGDSPSQRLLVPWPAPGTAWAGIGEQTVADAARDTVSAVIQLADGQPVGPSRRAGTVTTGIAALLVLLAVLSLLSLLWGVGGAMLGD